jgi:hypothetical protein
MALIAVHTGWVTHLELHNVRMRITHPLVDKLPRHDPRLEPLTVPDELDGHFLARVPVQR